MGADPVYTQGPTGQVMYGQPVIPHPAYPNQTMPSPCYYQPPLAYYEVGGVAAAATEYPPAYYYGIPIDVQEGQPVAKLVLPRQQWGDSNAVLPYQPQSEVAADFKDGSHKKVPSPPPGISPATITHLNLHSNRMSSFSGLEKYPNLLRLTVSWNNLTSLKGLNKSSGLRWIDASGNFLKDFHGIEGMSSLEWLQLTNCDVKSFKGLDLAPNLTWLCLHHNHFSDFTGADRLFHLRFLDVSDNDFQNVAGLEKAVNLKEINLSNNPMCEGNVDKNVESVKKLAGLPYLTILNITDTFYDKEEQEIVAHFRTVTPQVEVVVTTERGAQLGHNYQYSGPEDQKKGKCVLL